MGTIIVNIQKIYNNISNTYEETYVVDDKRQYMFDEVQATTHFKNAQLSGKIISLGVGSGQDIKILNHPNNDQFLGVDFSSGMIANGQLKFPKYMFLLHDCNSMIDEQYGEFDILVSMFGAANYLGVDKLLEHYDALNCSQAFFIFYNEDYDDHLVSNYHKYTSGELYSAFQEYNTQVIPLWKGSNYYVVWWNEFRNI